MIRGIVPGLMLLGLSGCSLIPLPWLPDPDPGKAWIDLHSVDDSRLQAMATDRQPLRDTRYFEVTPGTHQLELLARFTVQPQDVGGSHSIRRDCQLNIEYHDFSAGSRYRLEAGHYGFLPWARLHDSSGQLLAQGKPAGCHSHEPS